MFRKVLSSIINRKCLLSSVLIGLLLLGAGYDSRAQNLRPLYQSNLIEVQRMDASPYLNAFAGGLKFAVFASMDMNFDGKMDIVVLDRRDNRLLTFINNGTKGNPLFLYRPQFEIFFPKVEAYIYLRDYNGDKLPDLFTFSLEYNSGIAVYKNVSSSFDIKFELVEKQLNALYYGLNRAAIYTNSIDIPIIEDVDGDGDLDILTFSAIGQHMDYYKNLSVEKYGRTDKFDFILADACWGKFMEDDLNNEITLGINCGEVDRSLPKRHAGSTSLLIDLDADGDLDLLLGDVEHPDIYALINGKKDHSWHRDTIIEVIKDFPVNDQAIKIPCMPGLFYFDVDNDGKNDLIAAALDMDIIDTFKNIDQIWLYTNHGENNKPDFRLHTKSFLQEDMIDLGGSTSPVFFDYDDDGDLDLFVATIGDFHETYYKKDRIWLFENIGDSNQAVFRLRDKDYLNLSSMNLSGVSPHFADINGNGRKDLLLGLANGKVMYFKNTSSLGNKAEFELQSSALDGVDAGAYAVPFVFDLNQNGLPDLLCGKRDGNIHYYENNGTLTNPSFSIVNDTFGGISFHYFDREFSAPFIYDYNGDGKADLILGTRQGKILFYPSITDDLDRVFTGTEIQIRDSLAAKAIDKIPGNHLKPAIASLNRDDNIDIILGNYRGGLLYYSTVPDTVNVSIKIIKVEKEIAFKLYPNPANTFINLQLLNPANDILYHFIITDMTGKHVKTENNIKESLISIQISELKDGLYLLRVYADNQSYSKVFKFIVRNI